MYIGFIGPYRQRPGGGREGGWGGNLKLLNILQVTFTYCRLNFHITYNNLTIIFLRLGGTRDALWGGDLQNLKNLPSLWTCNRKLKFSMLQPISHPLKIQLKLVIGREFAAKCIINK